MPEDTYTYLLKNNLVTLLERIGNELQVPPRLAARLFAHTIRHLEGQYPRLPDFSFEQVYDLLKFLKGRDIDYAITRKMLFHLYQHPKMDFESILTTLNFKVIPKEEILSKIPFLVKKYREIRTSAHPGAGKRWVMGNLSKAALGNISLNDLSQGIKLD